MCTVSDVHVQVMRALEAAGLLAPASAKLLGMARVPLLKTELAVPGSGGRRRVAADICLGVTHGPRAVAFARDQVPLLTHSFLRPCACCACCVAMASSISLGHVCHRCTLGLPDAAATSAVRT